jgi:SAM-dependent methyltransferase
VVAENLPFPDHSFDHAVCLGALLYFTDPVRSLREIRRVVRPGGRVVIRTVNRDNPYTRRTGRPLDPASHTLLTLDELTAMVTSVGFRVDDAYAYGFWPSRWPDAWWYVTVVWLPAPVRDWISRRTPPSRRVNNIVMASCPNS